ncbi:Spindle assembly abnormal protein 6 [Podochytrium sp. JEL0797]|nr:Spindle assembly abnormal protein 6 [Podochytrium sp. JEL0797]
MSGVEKTRLPVSIESAAGTKTLVVDVGITRSEATTCFALTSPHDVFFLFALALRRADFDTVKRRLNLLVSFDAFANMATQLLRNCLDAPDRFAASLRVSTTHEPSTLCIVETNTFQHITHLSLDLVQGTDAQIKLHLADLVKQFEDRTKDLETQLKNTDASLSDKLRLQESSNASLKLELDRLKIAYAEQASRLELQSNMRIQKEKEDALHERDSIRKAWERERRELERGFEDKIRTLTSDNAALTSTNNQLSSRLTSLEQSHATLQSQAHHLDQDLADTRQDLASQRQQNQQLVQQNGDWERTVAGLRARLEGVERSLAEREEAARGFEKRAVADGQERGRLEEMADSLKSQNEGLEEAFRKASEEINKGNEIIRKIQTDLKSAKSKIKLKNVVTLQQEKLLDERASIIEMHEQELAGLKQTRTKQAAEVDELKARVQQLEKSVEEGKKIISENTHVIEWLHKQLNEDALTKPSGPYAASSPRIDFDKYGATNPSSAAKPSSAPAGGMAYTSTNYASNLRDLNLNDTASPLRYAAATTPYNTSPTRGGGAAAAGFKKASSPVRAGGVSDAPNGNAAAGKGVSAAGGGAGPASYMVKENLYSGATRGVQPQGVGYTKKSNYF